MNFILPVMLLGVPLALILIDVYLNVKLDAVKAEVQEIKKPEVQRMSKEKRETMFNLDNTKLTAVKKRNVK